MNVLEKSKRRWKKARKRGVSPIIATILLVAITVVLAAVLYVLISGLTSGGANTVPIGTAFSFSAPVQTGTPPAASTVCPGTILAGECYAIGIQSAGSSATTANVHFTVVSSGTGIAFTGIDLMDASGNLLASYTTSGGWVAGSATLPVSFSSTQTLILGNTAALSGDNIQAVGVGALQGTTAIALP